MKFFKIDTIAKTLLTSIFFMFSLVLIIGGSWWAYKKFEFFNEEKERIQKDYIESQKSLLKEEIKKLSLELNYEKILAQNEIDLNIKHCATEIYDIASILYETYKDKNDINKIKKIILNFISQKMQNKKIFIFETKN